MKVVINTYTSGISEVDVLVRRVAELKDITLYPEESKYASGVYSYWTIPDDGSREDKTDFQNWSMEKRIASNARYDSQKFDMNALSRTDSDLVSALEQLLAVSDEVSEVGIFKIVEIPDDVKFEIYADERGGESIVEKHRSWY